MIRVPNDLMGESGWQRAYDDCRNSTGLDFLKQRFWWSLDKMVAKMVRHRESRTILELGCGSGRFMERISYANPQAKLAGLDYSPAGLDLCGKFLKTRGIHADLMLGDMFTVDNGKRYDSVVSFGLIEHFDSPSGAIAAHARFVQPNGVVAVSVPNLRPPVIRKYLQRFAPSTLDTHNLDIMSLSALRAAFEAAGLDPIYIAGAGGPWLITTPKQGSMFVKTALKAAPLFHLPLQAMGRVLWPGHIFGIGKIR